MLRAPVRPQSAARWGPLAAALTRSLCSTPPSFIDRAAEARGERARSPRAPHRSARTHGLARQARDASVLLGAFKSSGVRFDNVLEAARLECTAVSDGAVTCELTVVEPLTNNYGTLHGGAISTLVDVVGTLALLAKVYVSLMNI